VNKIFFLLFIGGFFLDFSFTSSLLGSSLSWPYFTLSLLVSIFILNKSLQKNIIWIVFGIFLLNVLLPFNFLGYVLIVMMIWTVIYFLENVFFNEEQTYLKSNFIFLINFILFGILFFVGQCIRSKILGNISFDWQDINWMVFLVKLSIGVFIYNLTYRIVYKICGKNIQVLK